MDPNATLELIRATIERINDAEHPTHPDDDGRHAPTPSEYADYDEARADHNERQAENAEDLAGLVAALDGWMRAGGFMPDDWKRA